MKKGKLITMYGINNIGKSTQAKQLLDKLTKAGHEAVYVKFPVYDLEPTGPLINNILRNSGEQKVSEEELQMWFTLNRFQFEPTLRRWLDEAKIVVAEDYTGTGIAWGTAKGANLDWLISMNKHLLREDYAIFLKGKRQMHAKEGNHIHETDDDLVEACNFVLQNLADKFSWDQVMVKPSISETADEIWERVNAFLSSESGQERVHTDLGDLDKAAQTKGAFGQVKKL